MESKLKHYSQERDGLFTQPGPCHLGGFTYATNGFLVVRVPGAFGIEHQRARDCVKFLEPNSDCSGAPVTLTAQEVRPLLHKCTECHPNPESPTERIECPECDGEGEVEWETEFNHYEAECKTCGGDGTIREGQGELKREECLNCFGTGLAPKWNRYHITAKDAVPIGPAFINPTFVYLLATDFGPITFYAQESSTAGIPFRFEGGDGCVMPLVV